MPVRYALLPNLNLALFTYWGEVGLHESAEAIAAAAREPVYRPFMRQLCDLSGVTGYERDFPSLLKMQARILEDLMPRGSEVVVLFYAPSPTAQGMAQMARRSWEGLDCVLVLIQDSEAGALSLLGLPGERIADLSASV